MFQKVFFFNFPKKKNLSSSVDLQSFIIIGQEVLEIIRGQYPESGQTVLDGTLSVKISNPKKIVKMKGEMHFLARM